MRDGFGIPHPRPPEFERTQPKRSAVHATHFLLSGRRRAFAKESKTARERSLQLRLTVHCIVHFLSGVQEEVAMVTDFRLEKCKA